MSLQNCWLVHASFPSTWWTHYWKHGLIFSRVKYQLRFSLSQWGPVRPVSLCTCARRRSDYIIHNSWCPSPAFVLLELSSEHAVNNAGTGTPTLPNITFTDFSVFVCDNHANLPFSLETPMCIFLMPVCKLHMWLGSTCQCHCLTVHTRNSKIHAFIWGWYSCCINGIC